MGKTDHGQADLSFEATGRKFFPFIVDSFLGVTKIKCTEKQAGSHKSYLFMHL